MIDELGKSLVQNPSGLQGNPEGLLKLAHAYLSLGAGEKVDRLKPEMQFEVARLEDGADLDRERRATFVALVGAAAGAPAFELANLASRTSTMGTYWPGRPALRFAESEGCLLAVEMGLGKHMPCGPSG